MHYIESLLGASHKRVTEAGEITHLLTEEARTPFTIIYTYRTKHLQITSAPSGILF